MNRGIEFSLLLTLPACAALMTVAMPITLVLFQHGEFTATDTANVWPAMVAFAAGLPSFILIKIFAPGFFANRDTKTPFIIATICVGINLALNLILMQYFQHVGLAASTSIAGWVNAALMGVILYRRKLFAPSPLLISRVIRITLSTLFMVALLLILTHLTRDWLTQDLVHRVLALGILCGGGGLGYALAAWQLHAFDRSDLVKFISRKR